MDFRISWANNLKDTIKTAREMVNTRYKKAASEFKWIKTKSDRLLSEVNELNSKLSKLHKIAHAAEIKKIKERLEKVQAEFRQWNKKRNEMSSKLNVQKSNANKFDNQMKTVQDDIYEVIRNHYNNKITTDDMILKLNKIKEQFISEMKKFSQYEKVNNRINAKAYPEIIRFNNENLKMDALYKSTMETLSLKIDNVITMARKETSQIGSKEINKQSPLVAAKTDRVNQNLPIKTRRSAESAFNSSSHDGLAQQMSAFGSKPAGSIVSIGEQAEPLSPVTYCFGRTLNCGWNPTCGNGVTFA